MPNKSSPHGGAFLCRTISHGTLRPQDLLRAFAAELERLVPFGRGGLLREAYGVADILDDAGLAPRFVETAYEVLDDLTIQLNDIASREGGYYFGTAEGDGSHFGFWSIEEEDDDVD